MRTIKLCVAPSRRPTTLLGAIARSVADLEQTGGEPAVSNYRLQLPRKASRDSSLT